MGFWKSENWESGISGKWDFGKVRKVELGKVIFWENAILGKWDFGKVLFWESEIMGK